MFGRKNSHNPRIVLFANRPRHLFVGSYPATSDLWLLLFIAEKIFSINKLYLVIGFFVVFYLDSSKSENVVVRQLMYQSYIKI